MTQRWRLKVTTITGGFALSLIGDGGDVGVALNDALNDVETVEVVMEDGRILPLFDAVLAMIKSRVVGFVVLTDQHAGQHAGDAEQGKEWLH